MSELPLLLAWAAGTLLGAIFFGGLLWTVRSALTSRQPALWILGSLALRLALALGGFYFVSGGHLPRLLMCLLGFAMARFAVTWLTRSSGKHPDRPTGDASHAS